MHAAAAPGAKHTRAAQGLAKRATGAGGGRPPVTDAGSGGEAVGATAGAAASGQALCRRAQPVEPRLASGPGSTVPIVPPASTLRQMSPYDAVKESAALERRIDRAQVGLVRVGPRCMMSFPGIDRPWFQRVRSTIEWSIRNPLDKPAS
jgi:hypothetical protein